MLREEKEKEIASILGGLERVEAPTGFETRVMHRIMQAGPRQKDRGPSLLLVLKFAVPAAALLLMAMLVLFSGREVDVTSVPPIRDGQTAPVRMEDSAPTNLAAATVNSSLPDRPARTSRLKAVRKPGGYAHSRPEVNSEDMAVQGPGESFAPPGLDARPRNLDPSTIPPGRRVDIRDMLSFMGVSAACDLHGCRVASLTKGSLAERARLNVEDRIVSIDGRAVGASTSFTGPMVFKTFHVVRAGRTLNVEISPN